LFIDISIIPHLVFTPLYPVNYRHTCLMDMENSKNKFVHPTPILSSLEWYGTSLHVYHV